MSLYKEESQLKKRKGKKRKARSSLRSGSKPNSTKQSPEANKVRKVIPKPAKTIPPKVTRVVAKKPAVVVAKRAVLGGRAERAAKRMFVEPAPVAMKTSPVVDHKKAKVLAKVARRPVPIIQKNQAASKSKLTL